MLFLLDAGAHDVGDFRDGDEGGRVDGGDQVLDLRNLEAVHHKIDDALLGAGKIAPRADLGNAPAEFLRQGLTDFLLPHGHNHHGFGLVQTFHNEVDGFVAHKVGEDGVQRQNPALENHADKEIQNHVVDHHEGADGQAQSLCEGHAQHLHAVDSTA